MSTNQNKRPRLADILGDDIRESLSRIWDETQAAQDYSAIPKGRYLLEAVAATLDQSAKGTPAYCIRFRVIDPESPHHGRLVFHRSYLTKAALAISKRDLKTLGITDLDQLEKPLPQGIRVEADVIVRTLDDGRQTNELRNLKSAPMAEPDPFAPTPEKGAADDVPEAAEQTEPAAPQDAEPPATARRSRRRPGPSPVSDPVPDATDGGNNP